MATAQTKKTYTVEDISNSEDVKVANLREHEMDLVSQPTFGESGDVFDHRLWRNIMLALWSMPSVQGYLMCLANLFMLRGRSTKKDNKGSCLVFKIKLPDIAERPEEIKNLVTSGNTFSLKINIAEATSKVSSIALTPERLKCILRGVLTASLLEEGRFAAASESVGFGDMIRSLKLYEAAKKLVVTQSKITTESGEEVSATEDPDYVIWNYALTGRTGETVKNCSSMAAAAGSFSSKEIYMEDEEQFPGCIWWSGLHAMMTDASCKVRAQNSPADLKARLANADFYGDFKRKMNSRNITCCSGKGYIEFLSMMQYIVPKFIKAGSVMTSEEAAVLDAIIDKAFTTAKEFRPAKKSVELEGVRPKQFPRQVLKTTKSAAENTAEYALTYLKPKKPASPKKGAEV